MELLANGSGQADIFELRIPLGRPSVRNLLLSLGLHACLVVALFTITLPDPRTPAKLDERLSPTEVRLDGHLYYVSQIPASMIETRQKLTLPRAAETGKAPSPAARKAATPGDLPMPPQLTIQTQVPSTPAPSAEIAATRAQVRRILARTFVPPEVKRSPSATQTLIQPLSPPTLVPPPTPLPSFRVVSPQFPKIAKPFVAPGRKTPAPPAQMPDVAAPNLEMVHADAVPTDLQPKLALPRTPPPPEPVVAKNEGPPPAPAGEPVNVLSLSDRPAPMDKTVVVPPGNIVQESGEASEPRAGAAAGAAGASGGAAAASPAAARPGTAGSAGSGTIAGTGNNRAGGAAGASTSASGTGRTGGSANASGNAAGGGAGNGPAISAANSGNGAGGAGTSATGPGRGSVGAGIGSALTGGSPGGSTNAVVGSPNGGNGGGPGGTGDGRVAAGQVISRPPGGNFDAVVIQSSPVDQYPETRGLLSGRPIYSVYISAGAARDWTLFFCVPNEKPAPSNGPFVQLDAAVTPVRAPYPYKLVRPAVTLPSWEKYVLVHGYVSIEGRFQEVRIIRSTLPETDRAILASLADWQFRAATKDGVPVKVEFLLSIPAKGL